MRDPRMDPQPGDRILCNPGNFVKRVIGRKDDHVRFILEYSSGERNRSYSLLRWQQFCKNHRVEIITARNEET